MAQLTHCKRIMLLFSYSNFVEIYECLSIILWQVKLLCMILVWEVVGQD